MSRNPESAAPTVVCIAIAAAAFFAAGALWGTAADWSAAATLPTRIPGPVALALAVGFSCLALGWCLFPRRSRAAERRGVGRS